MTNIINEKSNIVLIALVLVIIIIIILGIALIMKSIKPKEKVEILDDNTNDDTKKNKHEKLKEIPIKNPSMIDDPASVRMSIEESKADLSNFNVKDDNKDDDII